MPSWACILEGETVNNSYRKRETVVGQVGWEQKRWKGTGCSINE